MNKQAIYHKSDSLYAFPLTSDKVELRLRAAKGEAKNVKLLYAVKHRFYVERTAADVPLAMSDELYDYFIIRLKLEDKRLAYIFTLEDGDGRTYYFSEDGLTEDYDFGYSYYSFFQLPYVNGNDVMPRVEWLSAAVVYQIFVDRFYRGERDEKSDDGYINMKWGDKPTPKSFAGGDLWGVAQKLDYLKDLGVNTLYLTPIFTSRSNHKYDVTDYYNVDPQFGGNAAFAHLMAECKKAGMRVILDAVFNHCGEDIAQFKDVVQNGKASRYHDWFVIRGDKPVKAPLNYDVFSECAYMPKWNTANPEVREYLCGIGEHWIKNYGIDGWRLDVSDEVSHGFWRQFRTRIKAQGGDVALIGENWHDSRSYLRGDQFDSIMNYAFTKAMLDFFVGGMSAEKLCDRLNSLAARNVTQVNGMMLNLLDCHDTHRFYTECGCDKNKLLSALAVNTFMPGATMVYYGTEIPLEGGYDPDSRRCFDWNNDGKFAAEVKRVLGYKKLPALHGCDARYRAENGAFVTEREVGGEKATLIVNNTDSPITVRGQNIGAHGFAVVTEGKKEASKT